MPSTPRTPQVSPNNPCPFLRALVAQGLLADDVASLGTVTSTIAKVANAGDGQPDLPAAAIRAIALLANGLTPLQMARNGFGGLRLNELRNGPLDKKGAGSRILDATAKVNAKELARLAEFASEKTDVDGRTEPGLDLEELQRMMDANFERAAGNRRSIDRKLMDGEWPILLKVMGKQGKTARYLSLKEVAELFVERRLPERMSVRLTKV
ncbi:MAG: hypothetical protein A2W72_12980 [Burkholderiales bacterium RIFCSPLOWO2_12_67_14]|nr:MAG: hypothetical protein A3I64_19845 [Burkholderiales bacterium RIFCSPLOWO2_02_FULL_67_64]OGB40752.1 MAG: hypothetical protein A3E51_27920 [Burkholderiales bacterium RIFCSPHIGHO2_12_FULL_67_38]OGB50584.1 MAG: hypothetical protein A2W72_12980 [Burkholderiales bacterium RIFCSPLOWO2_12_67_14]